MYIEAVAALCSAKLRFNFLAPELFDRLVGQIHIRSEASMASLEAPIVYAVYADDAELAIARIKNGNDVNLCDERYGCALTWAVQLGQIEVVKCLLENGADPNPKNIHDFLRIGSTPLHLVSDYESNCYRGELPVDEEIRELLIKAGGIRIDGDDPGR